jgi:hypothetical protein
LAILSCPGCSQKLRVPDGRKGTVTCPHCRAEWFHPETIELSDVEFRCSKSGARFIVISSRRSPLHNFVMQAINKATPKATHAPQTEPSSSALQIAAKATPALPGAGPKIGGWLVGIIRGKTANLPASATPPVEANDQSSGAKAGASSYDADEYNWSGFSCPYCNASSFVACAGGHLVCDGTPQAREGGRFHQCFCGQAGFITGAIKTLDGKRLSVQAEAGSPNACPAERGERKSKRADVVLSQNDLPTKQ